MTKSFTWYTTESDDDIFWAGMATVGGLFVVVGAGFHFGLAAAALSLGIWMSVVALCGAVCDAIKATKP